MKVLHHISEESRRIAAIAELIRIVRPGGRILLSVYLSRQPDEKKKASQQDVFVQWNIAKKKELRRKDNAKPTCKNCHVVLPERKSMVAYCRECYEEENRRKRERNIEKKTNTNGANCPSASISSNNSIDASATTRALQGPSANEKIPSRYFHFFEKDELELLIRNNFDELVVIADSFDVNSKTQYLVLRKRKL